MGVEQRDGRHPQDQPREDEKRKRGNLVAEWTHEHLSANWKERSALCCCEHSPTSSSCKYPIDGAAINTFAYVHQYLVYDQSYVPSHLLI